MHSLNIYHYVIALALILSIVNFRRLPAELKLFPAFLLLTLFVECVTPLKLIRFHGSNHWFFNIFTTIEFLYYSYIFYQVLHGRLKKMILPVTLGFLGFTIVNIYFIQGVKKFHTISYRVGAVMIIIWCFSYFRQLMQSEGYIKLVRNPMFWISTGLLFFYLGFFFYFSAFDYIVYNKVKFNLELWLVISISLNTLLYGCFAIAMACPRKIVT